MCSPPRASPFSFFLHRDSLSCLSFSLLPLFAARLDLVRRMMNRHRAQSVDSSRQIFLVRSRFRRWSVVVPTRRNFSPNVLEKISRLSDLAQCCTRKNWKINFLYSGCPCVKRQPTAASDSRKWSRIDLEAERETSPWRSERNESRDDRQEESSPRATLYKSLRRETSPSRELANWRAIQTHNGCSGGGQRWPGDPVKWQTTRGERTRLTCLSVTWTEADRWRSDEELSTTRYTWGVTQR